MSSLNPSEKYKTHVKISFLELIHAHTTIEMKNDSHKDFHACSEGNYYQFQISPPLALSPHIHPHTKLKLLIRKMKNVQKM